MHLLQLISLSPSCAIAFVGSLTRSKYLSLFLLSFNFTPWFAGAAKSTIRQILFLLLTIAKSGHLTEIK